MEAEVLYKDRYLLLCRKPVGVLSEASGGGGKASPEAGMPEILNAMGFEKVYPVHRLDRAVGGLMVFALDGKTAAGLSVLVAERGMTKEYLCVVHGTPGETSGRFTDLLFKDARKNKSFVVQRMRRGVKQAVLDYRVLDADAETPWGRCSLVRVSLVTGRSHQIRVQFASRGMPLVGDGKYGGSDNGAEIALYSARIAFTHPITGKPVDVSLPMPDGAPWDSFAEKGE